MADTATNHWKLGLFVLLGLGALIGALFWLGAQRFNREAIPAVTFFDESVQGLDVGSPVKFRGVTIGTVADITIAPDHRHVQVNSDIYVDSVRKLGVSIGAPDPEVEQPFMPPNVRVQLVAAGITGVRFLGVDFFDPERYPPPPLPFEPPWNYVPAAPSTLRSLEQAALEFANRLPTLGDQASVILHEGRETLGSIRRLSDELQGEDGRLTRLMLRLEDAAGSLEQTMRDSRAGETAAALREASNSVTGVAGDLNTSVLDLREELIVDLVALRDTLDSIRALVDSIERDPSALLRGRRGDPPTKVPAK